MDYEKFASEIKSRTAKRRKERADLQDQVYAASNALKIAKHKRQYSGTPDRYKTAQADCNKALEELQSCETRLNEFNSRGYIFKYNELISADEMLSNSYQNEQEKIEKAMKNSLKAIREQLLPLVNRFKEHYQTGNDALKMMALETEPDIEYSQNLEFRNMTLESFGDISYNDENPVEKVLTMIDAVLNDHYFSITVDNNNL